MDKLISYFLHQLGFGKYGMINHRSNFVSQLNEQTGNRFDFVIIEDKENLLKVKSNNNVSITYLLSNNVIKDTKVILE